MDAGLPTTPVDETAPLATTTTPDGKYRYVLYEWGVVGVQKATTETTFPEGWRTEYVIRGGICPCPGHQFRATCKHADVGAALQRFYADNAQLPRLGEVPNDLG